MSNESDQTAVGAELRFLQAAGAIVAAPFTRDDVLRRGDRLLAATRAIERPASSLFDVGGEWPEGEVPTGAILASGAVLMSGGDERPPSHVGPLVRSLVEGSPVELSAAKTTATTELGGGWSLRGGFPSEHDRARELISLNDMWSGMVYRDFAKSAPYMGAKRSLLPFIMTSLEASWPDTDRFVDLMCGSGVVAGAASRRWPTAASDAQSFSRLLALVQGGGMDLNQARHILEGLRHPFEQNRAELASLMNELVATEDRMFSASGSPDVVAQEYALFVDTTPGYPIGGAAGGWEPNRMVAERVVDRTTFPFCLASAYYANVFFGVRQSIEIDSLRYAIETIDDPFQREFCLGVLLVASATVSTTYGGHFAQPPAPPSRLRSPDKAIKTIGLRHRSVVREFELRMLNLARESQAARYRIDTLVGPWAVGLALLDADGAHSGDRTVVYVDAPYRREEYSRYYHVLEALSLYVYPVNVAAGSRMPAKGADRFASEFFTRSRDRMVDALASVLGEVLAKGYRCMWSYASRGDVDALDVLDACGERVARCRSVAAQHSFKRQGKASRLPPEVTEYLFLLDPT